MPPTKTTVRTVFLEGAEASRRPVLEALAAMGLRGVRVAACPDPRLRGVLGRARRHNNSNAWYGYYAALLREHFAAPPPPGDTSGAVVTEGSATATLWRDIEPVLGDFDDYHRTALGTDYRKASNAEIAGAGTWVYLRPSISWPGMEDVVRRLRYRERKVHVVDPPAGDRRPVDVAREIADLLELHTK